MRKASGQDARATFNSWLRSNALAYTLDDMHRRKFLTLAALTTPAAIAAEDKKDDAPYEAWWDAVESPDTFTAESGEGNVSLKVALFHPPEGAVKEVTDKEGFVSYVYEGKKLPERYQPGASLLKKFDLNWDGKAIKVDPRFWSDLAGLAIQKDTTKIEDIAPRHLEAYFKFLGGLQQPRVTFSADKGTILIEWERSEECDSRSHIRWMISQSGTVLRHRDYHDGC